MFSTACFGAYPAPGARPDDPRRRCGRLDRSGGERGAVLGHGFGARGAINARTTQCFQRPALAPTRHLGPDPTIRGGAAAGSIGRAVSVARFLATGLERAAPSTPE